LCCGIPSAQAACRAVLEDLFLSPLYAAIALFGSRRRLPEFPGLQKVAKFRGRALLWVVVVLTLPHVGPFMVVGNWWDGKIRMLDVGCFTVVAVVMAWRLATLKTIRRHDVPFVPLPALRAIFAFAFSIDALFALALLQRGMEADMSFAVKVLSFLGLIWLAVFTFTSGFLLMESFFGLWDAHQMLVPIGSIVTAGTLFGLRPESSLDHDLALKLALGGLLSTVVLGLVEIGLLYRAGIRLRHPVDQRWRPGPRPGNRWFAGVTLVAAIGAIAAVTLSSPPF
jgi:hypothetical protein